MHKPICLGADRYWELIGNEGLIPSECSNLQVLTRLYGLFVLSEDGEVQEICAHAAMRCAKRTS